MRNDLKDNLIDGEADPTAGDGMVSSLDLEKFLAEIDSAASEEDDFSWEAEPEEIEESEETEEGSESVATPLAGRHDALPA
jgi:RNA polymerase primary sigma factor